MKAVKLLILLLVLSLLSSCGIIVINDGKETSISDTQEVEITYNPNDYDTKPIPNYEDEAKRLLSELPDKNLQGHTVVITSDVAVSGIWDDVEGPYVSSVLKRNSMITDKYNAVVSSNEAYTAALFEKVKAAYLLDDFYADFVAIKSGELGAYYASESITNFKVLTYSDFSAPYFNQSAIDQMTFGGSIWGVAGSMTESPEGYGCLFFNKTLGDEIGISIAYGAIYNHEFTWDKLFADLAAAKTENALLTSSFDDQSLSAVTLLTAGQNYLSKDSQGNLVSNFNTSISNTVIANLKKLASYRVNEFTVTSNVTDENGIESTASTKLTGLDIFIKGKSLYAFGRVSDMAKIANCGFEWEILPIPMLTEGGRYNAAATDSASVLVLPKSSKSIEQNGYILQALGAASYKHTQTEYIKYAMHHYASSYYTFDMLELIIENPLYDHAIMLGTKYTNLRSGTYVAFHNAVINNKTLTYYINKSKSNLQKYLNLRN